MKSGLQIRRQAIHLIFAITLIASWGCNNTQTESTGTSPPNIVILFADDMGYGDLSSYGHPTIHTPNIDRLVEQGVRFTSFVTGSWCVPSRTQLITGRYMPRVEFGGGTGSDGTGGLPDDELTLAEALKNAGYSTGMAGKWHLGYKESTFLPPNQGFDSWFGLPYSNDYRKPWVQTEEPLALYRDTTIVEHPINQQTLTTRYTEEAVSFIDASSEDEKPFFFYLAYNMPHLPIHTAERFRGQSGGGFYGDVIETIDWSVGQVLAALEKQGVAENTIVFFASDNGPWLNLPDRMLQEGNKPWHQGTPGLLRQSKATTYEGGARVPALIRWPAGIPAQPATDELVASPDIYRTLIEVGGGELPEHPVDGYNIMPFLRGEEDRSPRDEYLYILRDRLEAMRKGKWKLRLVEDDPQLFDLQNDPGERFNRAEDFPQIVEEIGSEMRQRANELEIEIPGLNAEE
ncbi:sulfatase [Halalkalibaculum sp. DA3122]|uniref:sulfatase family protein n=1 Tax=Halalkalibaculum sp. DA3122 TaxID=3373607 RepID=UPI0037550C93